MKDILRQYQEAFGLNMEEIIHLDTAHLILTHKLDSSDRFIVVNELTRKRFKSTAVLLCAIEKGYDIFVPVSAMKKITEQNIRRITSKLGIETDIQVHTLSGSTHKGRHRKFLIDEIPTISHRLFKELSEEVAGGFISQQCYKELVFEGLL